MKCHRLPGRWRGFLLGGLLVPFVSAVAIAEETPPPAATQEAKETTEAETAPAFTITLDYSAAPECQGFAEKAKALCEEWYPKINTYLFGPDEELPRKEVTLVFRPMDGVAHAAGARIHISAEWVTKKAPDDYGMVIHELTHVVQSYPRRSGTFWVTEGIADYVREFVFEPGKRRLRVNPVRDHYKKGYTTSAVFLAWLEKHKNKDIIRLLNQASRDRTYTDEIFEKLTGKSADALWEEFAAAPPADREGPRQPEPEPEPAPAAKEG